MRLSEQRRIPAIIGSWKARAVNLARKKQKVSIFEGRKEGMLSEAPRGAPVQKSPNARIVQAVQREEGERKPTSPGEKRKIGRVWPGLPDDNRKKRRGRGAHCISGRGIHRKRGKE